MYPAFLTPQWSLLGGPLEASHLAVLDPIDALHTVGEVCEDVRLGLFGLKAPELSGLGHIPLILLTQVSGSCLSPW